LGHVTECVVPKSTYGVYPIWDIQAARSFEANNRTYTGEATASVEVSGEIVVTKVSGFRGAAMGRIERQFFFNLEAVEAATAPIEPTIIRPSSGTAILRGANNTSTVGGHTYNTTPPISLATGQPAQIGEVIGRDFEGRPIIYAGSHNPPPAQVGGGSKGGTNSRALDISDVLTDGLSINTSYSGSSSSQAGAVQGSGYGTGNVLSCRARQQSNHHRAW
jgi:hypothetical protein